MNIKWEHTNRGFMLGMFTDLYGKSCSIQKSSLATQDAIWFGVDKPDVVEGQILGRMHLSQEQVRELLPILQHFAETGEFPEDGERTDKEA